MRIWLWEYAFWVMGICILVMLGYGHDESVPYAWWGVLQPISWWTWGIGGVFALYFVGVKETFTKCSQRVCSLFDIHS